jgi:hypothetical protein
MSSQFQRASLGRTGTRIQPHLFFITFFGTKACQYHRWDDEHSLARENPMCPRHLRQQADFRYIPRKETRVSPFNLHIGQRYDFGFSMVLSAGEVSGFPMQALHFSIRAFDRQARARDAEMTGRRAHAMR